MRRVSQLVLSLAPRSAAAVAAGRIAIGVVFWRYPQAAVRLAGLDAPTAEAVTFLSRMTAARDLALGVGGVTAARRSRRERVAWTLAGALADTADCVAIAQAARSGRLRPGPAALVSVGAGLTAVTSLAVAVGELAIRGGAAPDRLARDQEKSSSG